MADTLEELVDLNKQATDLLSKYDNSFTKLDETAETKKTEIETLAQEKLDDIENGSKTAIGMVNDGGVIKDLDGNIVGGKLLQIVTDAFTDGAVTSTANSDDPTVDDGYGLFEVDFTPKSSDSKIIIQTSSVAIHEEENNSDICWLAAFADSDKIGIVSGTWDHDSFANSYNGAYLSLNLSTDSWGIDTKTIKIRAGMDNSSTIHVNGGSNYNLDAENALINLTILEVLNG